MSHDNAADQLSTLWNLKFTKMCSLRTLFCLDYESSLQNLLSLEAAFCILRRSHVLSGRCSTSKDLMKYGPIPQSKVCKQSNTANWHLLSPIHHCLTLSHTRLPVLPCSSFSDSPAASLSSYLQNAVVQRWKVAQWWVSVHLWNWVVAGNWKKVLQTCFSWPHVSLVYIFNLFLVFLVLVWS